MQRYLQSIRNCNVTPKPSLFLAKQIIIEITNLFRSQSCYGRFRDMYTAYGRTRKTFDQTVWRGRLVLTSLFAKKQEGRRSLCVSLYNGLCLTFHQVNFRVCLLSRTNSSSFILEQIPCLLF